MSVVTVALGRQQIVGLIGGRMEMVVSREGMMPGKWRDKGILLVGFLIMEQHCTHGDGYRPHLHGPCMRRRHTLWKSLMHHA